MATFMFTSATVLLILAGITTIIASKEDLIYGYECRLNKCVKVELSEENFETAISLPVCRMFCGKDIGTVWPKPTGPIQIESYVLQIDPENVNFEFARADQKQNKVWLENEKRFTQLLFAKIPNVKVLKAGGHILRIFIDLNDRHENNDVMPKLSLETDESYKLSIATSKDNVVQANLTANNFFGARHALETLSQLIVYDDIRREIQILAKAEFTDSPKYKWRGLLLDTSRNFYSVKAIKKTLDAMAMVKLNTFHWHITDSHSFPLEIKSQSELHKLGAYSARKVYTHEEVVDVVEYGRIRGIRVMPEFDAPAHVGEGWQKKDMTACFNAQPWKQYCVEPPCGQLDPTVEGLYPVLEDIYREMFELFDPDVFHMGGDEVSVNCWNSSERIRSWMLSHQGFGKLEESDFLRLWGIFQKEALKRVDNVAKSEKKTPIILWTSRLTDVPYIDEYLDKNRYVIQIWTTGADPKIQDILKRGFPIIISNYDALYFDCGGAGWVNDGNNWCSPYIGWQKVYENNLDDIANGYSSLVLGAEAAVWSEQIDEFTIDSRFWPRASALAERLWSNPAESWRQAEARMLVHRQRLTENGIGAEALQPEWCLQNEDECPINAYDAKF